jgi:hypothetical protein
VECGRDVHAPVRAPQGQGGEAGGTGSGERVQDDPAGWAAATRLCTSQEGASAMPAGKIKHNVTKVRLENINENLETLGRGGVVGRQVIVFD